MKIKYSVLLVAFAVCAISNSFAQNSVGIGTETPNNKAVLELIAINGNQGFLAPRLNTAQRLAFSSNLGSADNGMMVFDSDEGKFFVWFNSAWNAVGLTQLIAGAGISVNGLQVTNTGDTNASDDITITTQSAGDVLGRFDSLVVGGLQGLPLDSISPSAGFSLVWNGSLWKFALDSASNQVVIPTVDLLATTTQEALEELQIEILSITTSDDQTATEVSYDNASSGINETTVQGAIDFLNNAVGAVVDTDDQTAAEVVVSPAGNMASTDVQAALEELQSDIDAVGGGTGDMQASVYDTDADNIVDDAALANGFLVETAVPAGAVFTDDQAAAEVVVSPTGNLASTDVQAALEELQSDIDAVGGGSGDMLQSVYDTDADNIVDDAALVNGLLVETAVPSGAVFTDNQTAATVPVVPSGNLVSGNTQAALVELQGDIDANTSALATKANLGSPSFTGTPTAPTAAGATNTAQIATTAFVQGELAGLSVNDADADPTNELQDLSFTANVISLMGDPTPTTIDLSGYDTNVSDDFDGLFGSLGGIPAGLADGDDVGLTSVTSTDIVDGTIDNADINTGAAIAGTKISPDFGAQNITTTGGVTATSFSGNGASLTGVTSSGFSGSLAGDVSGLQGATTITDGAVTGGPAGKIADNSITSDDIAANAITTSKIADAQVTGGISVGAKIAANTIVAGNLVANTLGSGEIGTDAITVDELADGSVDTPAIIDGSVTDAKIASVTPAKISQSGASSGQVLKWSGSAWVPGSEGGDMLKATYDADLDDIVDFAYIAYTVDGYTVEESVPTGALFTDNQNLSISGNDINISGGTGFALAPTPPSNGQVLKFNGTVWDAATDAVGLTTVTSAEIVDGTITNADIDPAAAIAGTKVSPAFGSQNISTSGGVTAATFTGDGSGLTGITSASATNFTGTLVGDVTGTQSATVVSSVGGQTAANIASGVVAANAATNGATPSTIVARDASGDFSAGTITANLFGNASSANSFIDPLGGDIEGDQTTTVIAAGAVTGGPGGKIADGSITSDDIAANAITTAKIADGQVTGGISVGSKIAANTIVAGNLVANTLGSGEIGTDAVTADELADNSVDGTAIIDGTITNIDITDVAAAKVTGLGTAATLNVGSGAGQIVQLDGLGALPAVDGSNLTGVVAVIGTGAVGTTELADGAVTTPKITDDNITLAKLVNGSPNQVLSTDGAGNPQYEDKSLLAVGSATTFTGSLAGDITGNQAATAISNNAVTTVKIADDNVTLAKLAGGGSNQVLTTDVIGNPQYEDKSLLNVGSATNFSGTLSGDITGTQSATSIANDAVTNTKIADGAVTTAKIASNTIVAGNMATNSIGLAALDEGNIPLNSFAPTISDVSLNNFAITDLANPVSLQDAATKSYVDGAISSTGLSEVLVSDNDAGANAIVNVGSVGIGQTTPLSDIHIGLEGHIALEAGDLLIADNVHIVGGTPTYTENGAGMLVALSGTGTNFQVFEAPSGGLAGNPAALEELMTVQSGISYVTMDWQAKNLIVGGDLINSNELQFKDGDNSEQITFRAPDALGVSSAYVLPSGDGVSGAVLSTDGTGTLSWVSNESFTSAGEVPVGDGAGLVSSNIFSDGVNVGIGTPSPVSALEVDGTVTATAFNGDGSALTGVTSASATNFTGTLFGEITGTQSATVIANDVVTTAKIFDGTITNADIDAAAAIDGSKINPDFGSQELVTANGIRIGNSGSTSAGSLRWSGTAFDGHNGTGWNKFITSELVKEISTTTLATGAFSGQATVTGGNSFYGYGSGSANTTGGSNTFVGYQAGEFNSGGGSNTFIGYQAGNLNLSAGSNTALGFNASRDNETGTNNTSLGWEAGIGNLSSNNTFLGSRSGSFTTSGTGGNTFVGENSGASNTTGADNTLLGRNSDVSAGTLTNATAIGAGALVEQSNSLVLGGSGVNVGIGTGSPSSRLHVNGSVRFESLGTGSTRYLTIDAAGNLASGGTVSGDPLTAISPTVGYIPYFQSSTALDESPILATGTNVSIGGAIDNSYIFQVLQNSTFPAIYARNSANGGAGVWGYSNNVTGGEGVRGVSTGAGSGVMGTNDGTGYGGHFSNSSTGTALVVENTSTGAAAVFATGNVGIGTTSPTALLEVNGTTKSYSIEITGGNLILPIGQSVYSNGTNLLYSSGGNTVLNNLGSGPIAITQAGVSRIHVNSAGNVGIGTTSPGVALDVTGDIRTSIDFRYASAVTRTLSVSNKEFTVESSQVVTLGGGANGRYIASGTPGTPASLMAGVDLPDGAVVTQVTVYFIDNDATYNVTVQMARGTHTSTGAVAMISLVSAGQNAAVQNLNTTSITNPTIDNSQYYYFLQFQTYENSPNLALLSYRINYTVTKAD